MTSRTGNTRSVASLPPVSKELAEDPSLDRPKDQEISLANADTEAREELFDLAGELTEWLPLRDRSRVDLAAEGWLPGFAASPGTASSSPFMPGMLISENKTVTSWFLRRISSASTPFETTRAL